MTPSIRTFLIMRAVPSDLVSSGMSDKGRVCRLSRSSSSGPSSNPSCPSTIRPIHPSRIRRHPAYPPVPPMESHTIVQTRPGGADHHRAGAGGQEAFSAPLALPAKAIAMAPMAWLAPDRDQPPSTARTWPEM